ncbi:MAG: ATP-binding cassette domain-containing protein [Eubacteriaceae bacterium]|nr:ATP-binding cassette domain-containing protein [Eubacteriaceae bacterium]
MSLSVDIHKNLGSFSLDMVFESGGGILGLLGASGSGKSMTLMSIAGIAKPDRGRIVLDGVTLFDSEHRINLPPQRRKVGYLFQNYALFPNMTVRQNILSGLRRERDKMKREQAFNDIIAMAQLNGLERHKPSQLSGGQQQRVALARILVGKPALLMLDEPFSALDSLLSRHLQSQMQLLLKEFGKSVIIVTHEHSEAYRLCDELALADDGKVIAIKGAKALFSDPESRQAALFTGCENVIDAARAGAFKIDVPQWGVRLFAAMPAREELCAVGVRAHCFHPDIAHNRFPVCFTGDIEEPFEHILQFRYKNQPPGSPDLWWRVPKSNRSIKLPAELGVDPASVMPLYR